jgi:CRISPR system Cascade subunit CasB
MNDLMEFLRQRKDDRGVMATLRRGLIPGQSQRTWPLLARYNGIGDDYKERVVQIISGLYAMHPIECATDNFGASCRALMSDEEIKKIATGEEGPLSRRFHHLLAADGNEILNRVIRFVMRMKSYQEKVIPINYKKLREDLLSWQVQYKKDRIRTEWAKEFWATPAENKENEE